MNTGRPNCVLAENIVQSDMKLNSYEEVRVITEIVLGKTMNALIGRPKGDVERE